MLGLIPRRLTSINELKLFYRTVFLKLTDGVYQHIEIGFQASKQGSKEGSKEAMEEARKEAMKEVSKVLLSLCTTMVQETISYFIHGRSNVCGLLLDASEAFDRVNYCKLFKILLSTGLV